jgi:MinD-like ATPase involved in chromosome partitioning or flagellar assembly
VTFITFASIKGSPGVTTLTCLVGATWPPGRRMIVAECDSDGGDLAPRFSLSTKIGWHSLVTAARRREVGGSIEAHLQKLPGGLEVLVAPSGGMASSRQGAREAARAALCEIADGSDSDVIVDLGRLRLDSADTQTWLGRSDALCIVLRPDAASIGHVQERARATIAVCRGTLSLVVVGNGPYSVSEIESFTELPVIAEVSNDPAAAAVLTAGKGSRRRLARSALVRSARRLALDLADGEMEGSSRNGATESDAVGGLSDFESVPEGEIVEGSESKTQGQPSGRSLELQDQK